MSTDVKALLENIKNMKEYVVITEVPDGIVFRGTVPFNMSIKGNKGTFKVLAPSLEEATDRVNTFLSSN